MQNYLHSDLGPEVNNNEHVLPAHHHQVYHDNPKGVKLTKNSVSAISN